MFSLIPHKSQRPKDRRRDPFGAFASFEDALPPMMRDNFNPEEMISFRVDVQDLGKSYKITAELPGVKKENISLDYSENYLTISATEETVSEKKDSEGNYIHRERRSGSVSRSFYVDDIDDTKISAEFKDGILTIDLPKLTESPKKSSKIEIK